MIMRSYITWRRTSSTQNGFGTIIHELSNKCWFSTVRPLPPVNHYKILGVNPKSTQAEIKASFYKLSKIFHPDVSDQSDEAAFKFRQITAAYEILGNLKLRKMYDKGLLPHNSSSHQAPGDIDIEYEEQVNSPFKKSRSQPVTGRTDIYDFDQWSRLHYGATVNRRSAAKEKWQSRETDYNKYRADQESDSFIGLALFGVIFLVGLQLIGMPNGDTPVSNNSESKKQP